MLFDSYKPFTFMIALLFIYFMLLLFIVIITHNAIYRNKQIMNNSSNNSNQYITQSTCVNCIPTPTPISGSKTINS